ncbi:hypothetical protein [Pseudomonas sp. GOM6]|uniref:hypothetical protein n=1 Tax=Pseudomonas sp. GOM6 TaxID=3036944 RepID=UPI00240999C1|nr:hypothetical protein [Pseudomonas sp. GOM6]MDG1581013.1 hypothetical protein [Pseudomonas sp. GOM6]
MACTVEINQPNQMIIVNGVSINAPFEESSIESGHPDGPVLRHGAVKAVITQADADKLIAAGVVDRRSSSTGTI